MMETSKTKQDKTRHDKAAFTLPIRRDKLGQGMIKDGLEYLMINGKMFTTGYRLESVKQFHRCNAKVVTMTKDCDDKRAYVVTKIFVSYNTAVVALSRKFNACNDVQPVQRTFW